MATKKTTDKPKKRKDGMMSVRPEDYDYIHERHINEDRSMRSIIAEMVKKDKLERGIKD